MGKDFTITISQVVGGNYQPVTNLTNLNLRIDPFSSSTYSGTHIGDGVYRFTNVEDGVYKLYNDTTEVAKWGGANGRWIGDEALGYLPDDGGGHWDGQGKRLHDIDDPVSGIDVGDRDYNDARYLLLSGGNMTGGLSLSGNPLSNPGDPTDDSHVGDRAYNDVRYARLTGNNHLIGINNFLIDTGATKYPKIYYDDEVGGGQTYVSPTHPLHIATKQYADSLVAGITVPAVPYSGTEVLVIGNITQVVGKIYPSIVSAANHLNTLGLSPYKRGVMYIRNHPQINYYIASPGSLKDFVNIIGYAPAYLSNSGDQDEWNNLGTIIIVCEKTATKKMTISNSTLIFGDSSDYITQNQTGERTYNSFVYSNCVIIAYNNTTFNNCVLDNCIILHTGSFKATLQSSKIINCTFNNEPVVDNTNSPAIYTAGFTWTDIPNDITDFNPIGSE